MFLAQFFALRGSQEAICTGRIVHTVTPKNAYFHSTWVLIYSELGIQTPTRQNKLLPRSGKHIIPVIVKQLVSYTFSTVPEELTIPEEFFV